MAESSSTSANSDYDVFINHRGPDVKNNFASHLYRRVISHGLRVFLDQPELQRGDGLTRQIEGAIRSASVHVAIFSSGYAESAWCLKELVLMQESNSPIIPVFYHTKPSDLRDKEGRYARALEDLKKETKSDPRTGEVSLRYESNTIENWRTALSSVKETVGFDLEASNGDEGELVDKVVEEVLRRVKKPALDVAKYPTGLDDKISDFENTVLLPLQQSGKPQILGILGSGGVGKTTLAKELFNRKNSAYSRSCFLTDVRDYASKGTLKLAQRKLLKCLTGSDHPIDSVAEGIGRLRTHLSSANVLVIIDDVDNEDQIDALLPHQSVLHSNSLILITSRNKDVLTRRVENTSIYKLAGLNTPHAEELFCNYAFNQPHPFPGFESLVKKFLETCDGLPLSLKVFGALLNKNYDTRYWEHLLKKLEVPSEIQDKLQISFDSLTVTEQNIFLDMACFFIGEDRDMAIKIWEGSGWERSGWNGLWDFENIKHKCLVEVDSENKIKMHDHLRDLGRDLAKAPGLPRRLWSWKENDIDDLLQQSSNGQVIPVRGIRLVSSEYNDIHVEDALGRICMSSLQLLDGEGVLVEGILTKVLSPNLIWLRWKNCPCSSLPSSVSMKKLRVLHLQGERLETLWENESQAPLELRELEIKSGSKLKLLPNGATGPHPVERPAGRQLKNPSAAQRPILPLRRPAPRSARGPFRPSAAQRPVPSLQFRPFAAQRPVPSLQFRPFAAQSRHSSAVGRSLPFAQRPVQSLQFRPFAAQSRYCSAVGRPLAFNAVQGGRSRPSSLISISRIPLCRPNSKLRGFSLENGDGESIPSVFQIRSFTQVSSTAVRWQTIRSRERLYCRGCSFFLSVETGAH